jgi:hypothetical protein
MNKNQYQKYPNYFANNFSVPREMFQNDTKKTQNKKILKDSGLPPASCPPAPAPTPEELGSSAAKICQDMGIQSCSTSAFSAHAEVDAFLASASLTVSGSSTVGCEQVQIMANSYHQSQQKITCVIKQTSTDNSTSVSGINKIKINAGKDFIPECNLEIDQKLKITLVSLAQMSQEQKNEIANAVKTTTNDIINSLQDSKSGFGATPQGQKYISDSKTSIDNIDFTENVTQTINKITTNVEGGNIIEINAGGNIILRGKDCKITQDSVIEVMATSILSDSLTNIFSSMTEMTKKTETTIQQKAVNEGVPDPTSGKALKYVAIAIVLIVLLGGGAWVLSKQDLSTMTKNVSESKLGSSSLSSLSIPKLPISKLPGIGK